MLKGCARPGNYQIPQALEKKGEIPEDDNGVHVGVGSGWWYESIFPSSPFHLRQYAN